MRGEYKSLRSQFSGVRGSPPHAWGIRDDHDTVIQILRFTPTCVGNTYISRFLITGISVHPHMRGEYAYRASQPGICSRFTPTCVGNTLSGQRGFIPYPVHPHMRGEYLYLKIIYIKNTGSPPHAWGIRQPYRDAVKDIRFTPTCVGNTSALRFDLSHHSVHPHMRGEYSRKPKLHQKCSSVTALF